MIRVMTRLIQGRLLSRERHGRYIDIIYLDGVAARHLPWFF